MSLLSRLFRGGQSAKSSVEPTLHEGFRILPEPKPEQGQFRIAAVIEKEIGGETRRHHLIRADLLRDLTEAQEASVNKAKQMIDQMGDRLFD